MERVNWNQAVRPSTHDLIAAINSGADDIERIDGVLDVLETVLDGKADVSGTYPDFVAGEALSIRSGMRSNTFLARGLDADVADGIAEVSRILGNTVVWNQQCPALNDSNWVNLTVANSHSYADGVMTVSYSNASGNTGIRNGLGPKHLTGHKYLYSFECRNNTTGHTVLLCINGSAANGISATSDETSSANWHKAAGIKTVTGDSSLSLACIYGVGAENGSFEIRNPMIIDLTVMFGAGNEPQTVAEFEAMYPADYYAYSAPVLLSSNIAGIQGASACEFPAQTLRGARNAHDVMTASGIVRNIGVCDLGTVTWTKGNALESGDGFTYRIDLNSISNIATYVGALVSGNFVENQSANVWERLKVGEYYTSAQYLVFGSSAQDAAAFKTSMSGVMLQFKLATPTTEPFTEPIDLTYRVEAGGSESWIVPDGTQPTSAAVTGEIGYPLDPARALITHESFTDFIDKLGAYLGATITETWDGSKYTYSFASGRSALLGSIDAEPDALEVTEKDDMVKEIIEDERKEQ